MSAFLARVGGILAGLVVGAALIYALLPRARAREDRRALNAARADCKILLIGPSYANMVVPSAFEAEARELGFDKRLCKIGRSGLAAYELSQEIDFALSEPWPKLELVLIDVTIGRAPGFPEENWFKSRTVEWHNLAGMNWVLDYYRHHPKRSPAPRVWLAHVEHVFSHYVSLGRVPELFGWHEPRKVIARTKSKAKAEKKKKDEARKPVAAPEGVARTGIEGRRHDRKTAAKSGTTDDSAGGKRSKRKKARSAKRRAETAESARLSSKDRQGLAATAKLVQWNRAQRKSPEYGESEWLESLRGQVRRRGHDAFFVIAPVWYHPPLPPPSVRGDLPLTVLRFNDPERFPELYVPEARGNTHHLSRVGRPFYSRALARELFVHWNGQATKKTR
jgi:hypothetical protein